MSAHDIHAGHGDHHEEHDDLHVTSGDYIKGFILAVILTVIPFWLVMADVIQNRTTVVMVLGLFAVVQVVVHMVYFLHMNGKIQGGWTMMSTIFAIVFVIITLAGTLWVMFHMNANMMPAHKDIPALSQPAAPVAAPVAPAAQEAVAPEAVQEQAAPAAPAEHSGHAK
ncbi:cytochrome o ubiquinol oxidase subunit IV [Comamonas sp. Sa2CVA6]|uniref:Cytochrome bo(3) ubiquinol oxidase subunit 4 n=1 Tax=Comamonas avium TaxID=2762231 RepID=A0ABR8SEJ2_9BURK|nr:cytochrome o ubiquinol oxidase subunit IV [Comamonas avium]